MGNILPQTKYLNIQNQEENWTNLLIARSFPQKELCVVDTLQEYLTWKEIKSGLQYKKAIRHT